MLSYLILESPQMLFLFLQSGSKFLGTYYEVLAIISIYFGAVAYDFLEILFKELFEEGQLDVETIIDVYKETHEERTFLSKVSFIFTMIVCCLLAVFILPISTIVLASIELRDNAENLPKYDHGVYIYFLVLNSVWYLFLIITPPMCLGYHKCRNSC